MWRTVCTFFVTLALSASAAWAQSQIRIVRLSYVEGDVQLDRNDGQGLNTAFLNLPVIKDSILTTGHDGYAEVEFEDGSTARLTPDSELTFPELSRDDRGSKTSVWLQHGIAYFNLKHSKGDDFSLRVGSDLFYPSKKSHFRIAMAGDNADVAMFDGEMQLRRSNGQFVDLRKHETLSLVSDDSDRYFLAKNVSVGPDDDWDSQREKQHNVDLNQYGSYQTVSNYGSFWRPYGVGLDWDPYTNGAWVTYPYAGNIWVSYSPWGWTTYRYGNWIFVPGIGWGWQAGIRRPWTPTWNTQPVFVNPPRTFHPPQPPQGTRHPVIIVGRPPRDFDGDNHWHHEPRPPIVAGTPRPAGHGSSTDSGQTLSTNPAAVSNVPDSARVDRLHRDADTAIAPSVRPVSPTTSSTITPVHPVEAHPVRPERLPSGAQIENRQRSSPPPTQPTVVQTPRYSPPPSAPAQAPRYSPPPSAAAPAPHYSPPSSPPPSPPPARTAPPPAPKADPK
jgi:hypothetical protein